MNIGAQSRIAATFLEKDVGFWAAYLMSLASIIAAAVVCFAGRRTIGKLPCPRLVYGGN